MDRESSFDSVGNRMSVPYQESDPQASVFRGHEETLASLASPPVNVFTGPVSEYPAAARPPKTHTVVPPTEVGGSPRRVEDGPDSQTVVQMLCDRMSKLESDHGKMQTDHTRMRSEIDQLKNSVEMKDKELREKDTEIIRLKKELKEAGSQCAELEKKLADEREAREKQLRQQHEQHKEREKQLRDKIVVLERQKSEIEEERSLLIRRVAGDESMKESLQKIEEKLIVDSNTSLRTAHEPDSGEIKFTFSQYTDQRNDS